VADDARTVTVYGNRAVLPLGAADHKNGATITQSTLASAITASITYN
jgi:hypothetical protein